MTTSGMRRKTSALALAGLLALTGPLWSTPSPGASAGSPLNIPDRTLDMSVSLEDLARAAADPGRWQELQGKILLLEGVAATVMVYADEPHQFYAEIELVGGAWQGVQEVSLFRAWLVLDDLAFSGRIAQRPPRTPSPGLIQRNTRLVAAVEPLEVHTQQDGTPVAVVRVLDLRGL
ncbi:hypothetical protein [Alkalispirochaeta sphaeroplastigenens]|nr:hypothetical protein [Alkalispirochaeta sphaeroplastigenens]